MFYYYNAKLDAPSHYELLSYAILKIASHSQTPSCIEERGLGHGN